MAIANNNFVFGRYEDEKLTIVNAYYILGYCDDELYFHFYEKKKGKQLTVANITLFSVTTKSNDIFIFMKKERKELDTEN